ncbi:MAG: DUF4234 domain-containing protein [Eubacteriales bacterium]|nr:DUF4234 domain-containing protein [Eubacteriales bacterium]
MERRKEDRSLLILILLSVVTCGIYGIIFYWNMYRDINVVCREKENDDSQQSPNYLIACLLSLITCGIYHYYWLYKQGNRMQRVGKEYGIVIEENGTTYLLWGLIGVLLFGVGPLVAMYFMIKNLNRLCMCFNQDYVDNVPRYGAQGSDQRDYGYIDQNDFSGGNQMNNNYQNNNYQNNNYQNGNYQNIYDNVTRGTEGETIGLKSGMLVCTKGSMNGAQIPLQNHEIVTIGRDSAVCNLVLTDMDVSRRHCTVQYSSSENCYYVTDYSSLGVRINGYQRMEKNVLTKCERGTRLLLGEGKNEILLQ